MAIEQTPHANQEPDWNSMDPDAFADAMEARVTEAGKLLTCDEMDLIEERWRDGTRDRRCSLIMLTEEYPSLRQKVMESREFAEAMASVMGAARQQAKFLAGLSDLMRQVEVRAMLALANREDMDDVIKSSEAPS